MKKISLLLGVILSLNLPTFGQENEKVNWEEKVEEFRAEVYNVLAFTAEEQEDFAQLYDDYVRKQFKLIEKKSELLQDYKEEMAEDDTAEDEAEETAEFIEEYWEADIAQMELRKDYFDKMEDAIGWEKAFKFFLFEQAASEQMIEVHIYECMPEMENNQWTSGHAYGTINSNKTDHKHHMDKSSSDNYGKSPAADKGKEMKQKSANNAKDINEKSALANYNHWCTESKGMKEGLDHLRTRSGIEYLAQATTYIANKHHVETPDNWTAKEKEIMNLSAKLGEEPYSDKHSDIVHSIFAKISDNISALYNSGALGQESASLIDDVKAAADDIDKDTLLLEQQPRVLKFFEFANKVLNDFDVMEVHSK